MYAIGWSLDSRAWRIKVAKLHHRSCNSSWISHTRSRGLLFIRHVTATKMQEFEDASSFISSRFSIVGLQYYLLNCIHFYNYKKLNIVYIIHCHVRNEYGGSLSTDTF